MLSIRLSGWRLRLRLRPRLRRRTWVVLGLALVILLGAGGWKLRPYLARYVPYTFAVNSTGDGGDANLADGVCQTSTRGQCTLRAAIEQANARAGRDTIVFNVKGNGVHTIKPAFGPLPAITQPIVIDGYTQPGATPNTNPAGGPSNAVLRIELNGASAGSFANGLAVTAGYATIRGLAINGFAEGSAIHLENAGGSFIEGNFIGTDAAGTRDLGNRVGIAVFSGSNNNTIGGAAAAARNVISGNRDDGLQLGGTSNTVLGNLIGADATGARALANGGRGLTLTGSFNTVGGSAPDVGNVIAFNTEGGVGVLGATGNSILANSIHSNGGPGIDLPARASSLQPAPALSSAMAEDSTVHGILRTSAGATARLELFTTSTCDPRKSAGKTFVGSTSVTADDAGSAVFQARTDTALAVGEFITATSTDHSTGTSTFSKCVQVPGVFTVNSTADSGDASPNDGRCETVIPGECTLRAAIDEGNASGRMNFTRFAINGPGPHAITPESALPPIMQPMLIDGYTQPGAAPNTSPSGSPLTRLS